MSATEGLTALRRRLLGVALLVVLALVLGFCVAAYHKAFTAVVPVTLRTDHVGNQLQAQSDVKVRGLIVGEVRAVRSDGAGAILDLALSPEMAAEIPRNVSARLLPKTLFGERYVALQIPDAPTAQHIAPGDTIGQDRTESAIELEKVFDSLLPLLQAVQPQKLSETLGALSAALDGRGGELGTTLVTFEAYLSRLNTALPALLADISGLADLGDTYHRAAPDLVAALSDLTVTSRTLVDRRRDFDATFRSLTTTASTVQGFLSANRDDIIALAPDSRPTLQLLARYSPEFPCLLGQLATLTPRIDQAFRNDELHVDLEITQNRGKYVPGDEPQYLDRRGPRCYQNPPGVMAPQNPPGGPIKDGSSQPPVSRSTDQFNRDHPDADQQSMPPGSGSTAPQSATFDPTDLGPANSAAERELIAELIGPGMGRAPAAVPAWASYLIGPLLRGAEVTLR